MNHHFKPSGILFPPMLPEALGYQGESRWIALYDSAGNDGLIYSDGIINGSCNPRAWILFEESPVISGPLRELLENNDTNQVTALIVDRETEKLLIAPVTEVVDFLREANSCSNVSTEEEMEEAYELFKTQSQSELNKNKMNQRKIKTEKALCALQNWLASMVEAELTSDNANPDNKVVQ